MIQQLRCVKHNNSDVLEADSGVSQSAMISPAFQPVNASSKAYTPVSDIRGQVLDKRTYRLVKMLHRHFTVPIRHGFTVPIRHVNFTVPIRHGNGNVPIRHGNGNVPMLHGNCNVPMRHALAARAQNTPGAVLPAAGDGLSLLAASI
eukprot:364097-Chlamydomonas_euryale.AAC.2